MKNEKITITILSLLLFMFFNGYHVLGQCTGGASGGPLNPVPATTTRTMTIPAGSAFYTFTVTGPCIPQYMFSLCAADGGSASFDSQITIMDNTGAAVAGGYNDDFCGTQSKVTWTPPSAGVYRVRVNLYNCVNTTASCVLAYQTVSSTTNTAEYVIIGSATTSGSCINVTPNLTSQRGCSWDINSTLNFLLPFSYDFNVNLGASDAGADGMAFVIQNDPQGRCECGSVGGGMGAGGITNSLIIEIDTYINYEDRDDFVSPLIGCTGTEDPDHLDIWLNGSVNPDLDANCNAVAAGERVVPNAIRLQNPPGTNYNIENGVNHILKISWTPGAPGTLRARVLNAAQTTTYGTISTTLNPLTVFGTNTPFFGFTASTGGLSNSQSFCNPPILLPVEITGFEAVCSDGRTKVEWASASERNNKYFILEKSTDAIQFTEVYRTDGLAHSVSKQVYTYWDQPANDDVYYYRLKYVSYNGQEQVYQTIKADQACFGKETNVLIYPNPADNNLNIKITGKTNDQSINIELKNEVGITILKDTMYSGSFTIPTHTLKNGFYLLQIISNGFSVTKKVVIQH
ncbi:MAG: T9SS type A sorting domain-containing protein [Sediminibacterium sp.]|nr:T9SS type A sorting domain-containing protein [Sediminibacterium sp.]